MYVCLCPMCIWWPQKPKRTLGSGDKDGRETPCRCWGSFTICTSLPHNSISRLFELVFFLHSKTQRLLVKTEPLMGLLSCKLTRTHLSSTYMYKHTHSLFVMLSLPQVLIKVPNTREDSCLIRGVNKTEHSSVGDPG